MANLENNKSADVICQIEQFIKENSHLAAPQEESSSPALNTVDDDIQAGRWELVQVILKIISQQNLPNRKLNDLRRAAFIAFMMNESSRLPAMMSEFGFKKDPDSLKRSSNSTDGPPKKKSALEEITNEQERRNGKKSEATSESQPKTWLLPDIIVRVVVPDLGSKFYNQKAIVDKLINQHGSAIIQMLDTGINVKVTEAHLKTVVPEEEGSKVIILKGKYRGRKATIAAVDAEKEKVYVLVDKISIEWRTEELNFDDVSRFLVRADGGEEEEVLELKKNLEVTG